MRVIDLSLPIKGHFRWKVETVVRGSHAGGDVFQSTTVTLPCHAFTHVDAPSHFLPGARHISQMPVDQWVGDAVVVDLTHLGENRAVTADELERRAEHVRGGDIVLLRTDWPLRVGVENERFWSHAPYTDAGACHWLVRRRVKAVGYDYPPDYCIRDMIAHPEARFAREESTTHFILFPAGVTVVEYLTNLHEIRRPRFRFAALPLAIEGADGSPVRAVAFVD
jgi:kynurenine formamidase